MAVSNPHALDPGDEVTLSTGETIRLPVTLEATMNSVILPGDRAAVDTLLPEGLSPIRAGRGTAPVWLLSVAYHDVGGGAMEPYDEFAVVLGATTGGSSGVPYVSPVVSTEGYVWYMPVTHEPARAFGDEIWGYPKVVGDVDFESSGGRRHTTVTVDGQRVLTTDVAVPRTVSRTDRITAYAVTDDRLLRIRGDLDAEMGLWPYSDRFSVSLGEHPRADTLRNLDLGDRAFTRFYADGELTFYPGEPVIGPS
ncbi:MAG: acetoacetate decarboxylase family protein [Haloarculaceae archaeon]